MYRLDYTYKNYHTRHVSKQTFFFEKKEDALKLIASGRAVDDLMDNLCDENYGYHKIKYLGGFSEEDRKNRLVALDKSDTFHVTSVYELYEESGGNSYASMLMEKVRTLPIKHVLGDV